MSKTLRRVCFLLVTLTTVFGFAQQISSSPTSISFGNVYVGKTSAYAKVLTITNITSSSVQVSGMSFSCPEYQLSFGVAPITLSAQGSTHYAINFVPDKAQTFSCNFTLSVTNGSPLVIPLSGSGLTTTAVASVSPTLLNFSNQTIGTTSVSQTVNVSNTGTQTMKLTGVTVIPFTFIVSPLSLPVSIAPGQAVPISISYQPNEIGTFSGVLDLSYDSVPDDGVTLAGNSLSASSLVISTSSALPQATQSAAYQATLNTNGGIGPYTWSLASVSLPTGLSLSTAGLISGTLDPSVTTGNYSFTVQVTDSRSAVAMKQLTIGVNANLGDNCNDLLFDVPGTTTPMVAITDLGTGTYQGSEGGLYPSGSNVRPASHDADGVSLATAIQPLDANGNPSPTGKYALLVIGESTAENEFNRYMGIANVDPAKNPHLVFVNGAQGGATPRDYANINSAFWSVIFNFFLPQSGVTANQVVAVWMEDTDGIFGGTFPTDITTMQGEYESIMQNLHTLFPHLTLAYMSSRVYAGYSNGVANAPNPEPYAYEVGFAVKWAIQDQLNGASNLNYSAALGPVMAPWMSWGPYYWSNGMLGRSDDLVWDCADFLPDGTHPSPPSGQLKVASALLNFFKTDDTTTSWYLSPTGPSVQLSSSSLTFSNQVVGTSSAPQAVTLTNTGNASLNVSGISSSNSEFSESDNCTGLSIAPSGTCTINVTFTPTAIGMQNAKLTITDNASNSPQSLGASGSGVAASPVTLNPSSLSFGNQTVGTTSQGQAVTLTNNQSVALSITSISTSTNFGASNNCGNSLAAGGSCTITVTFTPTTSGLLSGTLSINDDASGSPQTVGLSGTGVAAAVTLSTTNVGFGNQPLGTSSAATAVSLTNSGGAPLSITSVSASGNYTESDTCAGQVFQPSLTCTINVTFSPALLGTILGEITIVDGAAGSPQLISLSGAGVTPVSLSPTSLTYGNVSVGTTSSSKTVTVTNNLGTAVTLAYAASSDYAAVGNGSSPCGSTLAAGRKCTLAVTFSPNTNGGIRGGVSISYNASYSPQVLGLNGTGINGTAGPLTFSVTVLTFSNVVVGASLAKTVTITNSGATTVNISSLVASVSFSVLGSGSHPCGGALAAGAQCTISTTFTPNVTGSFSGSVAIFDDASVSPQILNLSGTAISAVTLSASSLSFAAQTMGTTSPPQTITLTNNQSTGIALNPATVSGDYLLTTASTNPCGSTLAAKAQCNLAVAFSPTATGTISGVVTVGYGASFSPQEVSLSGTGQ